MGSNHGIHLVEREGFDRLEVEVRPSRWLTVGDRIAFLHEGRIAFDGTVDQARQSGEPRLRAFLEGGGHG